VIRIATWDLETSGLEGDVGRLLCGSILDHQTGEMTSYRNDKLKGAKRKNMADDLALAVAIRNKLEHYHITVGWFSKGFDIPFLNTRLVKGGERMLAPHMHLDPIWFCKGWRGIKPRSAKMAVMAEFFNLPERKPGVDVDVWIDAALGGDSAAMDILVDRCESDVRITAQLAAKILDAGLIKNIQIYP